MKHLREGSVAWRVGRFRDVSPVRVVLQHDTLGTFFDSGKRVMQAWHGELHETREEAEQYVAEIGVAARKQAVGGSGKIIHVR